MFLMFSEKTFYEPFFVLCYSVFFVNNLLALLKSHVFSRDQ